MAEITPRSLGLEDRVTMKKSDARNFRVYETMRNEAERRGLTPEVIDDTPAPKAPDPDPDGITVTSDGSRLMVVQIGSHAEYLAARAKAAALDAELIIR